MLKRFTLPIACLVTGLVAGYLLGLDQKAPWSARQHTIAANTPPDRPGNAKPAASTPDSNPKDSADTKDATPPSLLSSLDDLVQTYDAKTASQLTASLSLAEIQQAIQHLSSVDKASASNLRVSLFRAWAGKDPQAAWKAAFPLSAKQGRIQALAAIAAEFAKTNPQAAIDLTMTLARGAARERSLQAAFAVWAENDFQGALAYFQQHSEIPIPTQAFFIALNKLFNRDPLLALELSKNTPGGNSTFFNLLPKLYKKDPQAAIRWVMSQEDPRVHNGAFHTLLRSITADDPRKAMEFLNASNFAGNRTAAEGTIFAALLEKNLPAALDYLASNPGLRNFETGTFHWQIISALSNSTSKERAQLLARLPDDEFKFQLMAGYANGIASKGHYPEAVALLNNLPDSKSRDSALHSLGSQWGGSNPVSIANWLNLQPDSTDRDLVVTGFAGNLARNDHAQDAIQWSSAIKDPHLRTIAFKEIAYWWMKKDPAAANTWLQSSTIPASDKEEVLRLIRENGYPSFKINVTDRR